jgi:hypothetical protein
MARIGSSFVHWQGKVAHHPIMIDVHHELACPCGVMASVMKA